MKKVIFTIEMVLDEENFNKEQFQEIITDHNDLAKELMEDNEIENPKHPKFKSVTTNVVVENVIQPESVIQN